MTNDFENHLQRHLESAASEQAIHLAPAAADIVSTAQRRSRRRVAMGGAMASILLVGGGYLAVSAGGPSNTDARTSAADQAAQQGEGDATDNPVPTTEPPTTAISDSSDPDAPDFEPDDGEVFGSAVFSGAGDSHVAATGDGFVQVGGDATSVEVATSADGESWSDVATTGLPDGLLVSRLLHYDGQTVVVGMTTAPANPVFGPTAVFVTDDLSTWRQVDLGLESGDDSFVSVQGGDFGPNGLLLVASVATVQSRPAGANGIDPCGMVLLDTFDDQPPLELDLPPLVLEPQAPPVPPVPADPPAVCDLLGEAVPGFGVRFRTDGVATTFLHSADLESFTTRTGPDMVGGVLATDDGFLVVGSSFDENGPGQNEIWRSADGVTWEVDATALNAFGASDVFGSFAQIDEAIVLVGECERKPAVWRSTDDGATWDMQLLNELVADSSESGDGGGSVSQISAGDAGAAAVIQHLQSFAIAEVDPPAELGDSEPLFLERDGFVIQGPRPGGPFQLIDADGEVVQEWGPELFSIDSGENVAIDIATGTITMLDPETGDELVQFALDEVIDEIPMIADPFSSMLEPQQSLVFSADGEQWTVLDIDVDGYVADLAVGDDEVVVLMMAFDGAGPTLQRIPLG